MRQVVQNIKSGTLSLKDVPEPAARPGIVVIANSGFAISASTGKMTNELAKKWLLGKAWEQPD